MNYRKALPEVVDKTSEDIQSAIIAIENSNLPTSTKQFVIACVKLTVWLPNALLEKQISLSNLRKIIFGRGKSKACKKQSNENLSNLPDTEETTTDEKHSSSKLSLTASNDAHQEDTNKSKEAKPGHGRHKHDVYTNAIKHELQINGLTAGDFCPLKCGGKLYDYQPGILVRIKGQHWANVHKYHIQKLRCALCGKLFSADIPVEVGSDKYDIPFKAILTIQKYYIAVPFYRQAYFQSLLSIPLSPSVQWQLVEDVASSVMPVFKTLEKLAANADIIHADDSHLKIVDIIKDNRKNLDKVRTGMFTTGILSKQDDKEIVLFYNGTEHAGENLIKLLTYREPNKSTPIYMCDALSRNVPSTVNLIVCHCLAHAFRKFDDLQQFYPDECDYVMKRISRVYEHDKKTKKMTVNERLTHHQKHSTPLMEQIKEYIS